MRLLKLFILAIPFIASGASFAGEDGGGHREGNGGAAWGCFNPEAKTITKIRFLDLVEVELGLYRDTDQIEEHLPFNSECGEGQAKKAAVDCTADDYLNDAMRRTERVHSNFYQRLLPHMAKVNRLWPSPGSEFDLTNISDYGKLFNAKKNAITLIEPKQDPEHAWCAPGEVQKYVQIINFLRDESGMLVNLELYNRFAKMEQAAAKYHEAVFSLLRAERFAPNSIETRKIVAYAFSSSSDPRFELLLNWKRPSEQKMDGIHSCGTDGGTIQERYLNCYEIRPMQNSNEMNWKLIQRKMKGSEIGREIWLQPYPLILWGNFIDVEDKFSWGEASALCNQDDSLGLVWSLPKAGEYLKAIDDGLLDVVRGFLMRDLWTKSDAKDIYWTSDSEVQKQIDSRFDYEEPSALELEKQKRKQKETEPREPTIFTNKTIKKWDGKARVQCVSRAIDMVLE